jgi:thiol-disulfide isomerase/thioredoxin
MKTPILFLLVFTAPFLLQAHSPALLNGLSSSNPANPAEKPLTVSGSFAGYNLSAGLFQSNLLFQGYSDTTSERFFDKLMAPYKGKVVYIDFWAPWCGPCMGEMPYSKELQKELAGKDVVFLYIGIGCSKRSWENTIKEMGIEGEHYFASENDGKLLSQKFNISGIPRYILVGKDGKVADDEALRPSYRSKLVKKINGLLK